MNTEQMKLVIPAGAAHFANIYNPLQPDGAVRPLFGFSIDREYLEGDTLFDEMFVKTPGSRDRKAIPCVCKRRPEVMSNDVDALVDSFLECQARNVSPDEIFKKHDVEIEFTFFDLSTVGKKGLGLSLKSVKVLFAS